MGRHLGIDFGAILMDFGSQLEEGNRAKIDQKRDRKMMKKCMPSRCPKNDPNEIS